MSSAGVQRRARDATRSESWFEWTPERVTILTTRYASGDSFAQIAEALGGNISRNACIGKAKRLGLERSKLIDFENNRLAGQQNIKIAKAVQVEAIRARKPAAAPVKAMHLGLQANRHTAGRAKAKAKVIIAGGGSVHEATTHSKELSVAFRPIPPTAKTLREITPGECLMVVGDVMALDGADTLFCAVRTKRVFSDAGVPTFRTYCCEHHAEAYRPLPGGGRPTTRQLTRELRRHL